MNHSLVPDDSSLENPLGRKLTIDIRKMTERERGKHIIKERKERGMFKIRDKKDLDGVLHIIKQANKGIK
jgi:hypothetical protein